MLSEEAARLQTHSSKAAATQGGLPHTLAPLLPMGFKRQRDDCEGTAAGSEDPSIRIWDMGVSGCKGSPGSWTMSPWC